MLAGFSNGWMQSGVYAAVICAWKKMKVDQEVDIYHTVKQLRFHMPNLVQDLVSGIFN